MLERTQPGLPLAPKRPRTMTHDYVRHGTATLFAALVIRAGSFTSVRELLRDMEDYLAERNAAPIRYVWKAQGAEILEKIRRARAALAHVQAA